jgi:hypothetical protein
MAEKKIIYILIAKNQLPLAGYSEHTGEFVQTCENMLPKVKKESSAAINLGTGFIIFYINENDITYMIMAGSLFPKLTAIGCIESIKKEFQSTYIGRDFDSEAEYGLNEEFKDKLEMKYKLFNENTEISSEVVHNLKEEILKMRDEVYEASNLLNQREDEINNMNAKAEALAVESEQLRKGARQVRKSETKKKIYLWLGLGGVGILIIYFIICMACQSFTFQC